MRKSLLASTTTGMMVLLLLTACAEDSQETVTVEKKKAPVTQAPAAQQAPKETAKAAVQDAPIMNQPVDFSTPENISKSLANIKDQAGARAARKVDSAMGYIMTYDLAVNRDEAKMYKKLNGKTPNQIIAMGSVRR